MPFNALTKHEIKLQVQKGGEMLLIRAKEDHKEVNRKAKTKTLSQSNGGGGKKKSALNKNLKR